MFVQALGTMGLSRAQKQRKPGRVQTPDQAFHKGGAEGTRTPDPHTASVVRYQLRHSPLPSPVSRALHGIVHTRRPDSARTRPQFSDRSGGKWASRGQDVALPAQDHRPQVVGAVDERVAGQGVEHEPGAGRDLAPPSGPRAQPAVAGENPDASDAVAQPVRVGGQVDCAQRPGRPGGSRRPALAPRGGSGPGRWPTPAAPGRPRRAPPVRRRGHPSRRGRRTTGTSVARLSTTPRAPPPRGRPAARPYGRSWDLQRSESRPATGRSSTPSPSLRSVLSSAIQRTCAPSRSTGRSALRDFGYQRHASRTPRGRPS